MFGHKIKLNNEIYRKCKDASEKAGCSSVEEFVITVIERETEKILNQSDNQQDLDAIKNKLQGLGYID